MCSFLRKSSVPIIIFQGTVPQPLTSIHGSMIPNLTTRNQNDRNGHGNHGRLHARRRCFDPKPRFTVFPRILLTLQ